MEETQCRQVGVRPHRQGEVCSFVCSLLVGCLLAGSECDYPQVAAELRTLKTVLVLYLFNEHGFLKLFDQLKPAFRSRFRSPANFDMQYIEAQGDRYPSFEKSLSEAVKHEFDGVKADLQIPAARILSGENGETLPAVHGSAAYIVWPQLRRWDIGRSALDPGTIVMDRMTTTWGPYQKHILLGVAVIIFQTLLIAALLLQRARRKSATKDIVKLGEVLIHAQDEERAKIARELHDDFSQRLAIQCFELAQLEKNLPASEVEERSRALGMLRESREMAADMRSLSHQLHSSRLELVGLVPALRGVCEDIARHYKFNVDFTEPEFLPDISKELELCLFRITQEALANVVKHSQATSAHVELGANANGLRLRISDTGNGYDTDLKSATGGIGLIAMRERLRLVGGRLSVRSKRMLGTEILAEIPLPTSKKWAGGADAA